MRRLSQILPLSMVIIALVMVAPAWGHHVRPFSAHMTKTQTIAYYREIIWHDKQQVAHANHVLGFFNNHPRVLYNANTVSRKIAWHEIRKWRKLKREHRGQLVFAQRRLKKLTYVPLPTINDWLTAVAYVDHHYYPGSAGWLDSCSESEGGHGAWVWIGHASSPPYGWDHTPGGWLQYWQSTFWSDYRNSVSHLTEEGLKVPPGSASYQSALGQALAGAWHSHYQGTGQWTGSGC